jgi:hypothetical protein
VNKKEKKKEKKRKINSMIPIQNLSNTKTWENTTHTTFVNTSEKNA